MTTQLTQQKITPFLWFNDNAEEAAQFYTLLFDDSRILTVTHYGKTGRGPAGSVMTVKFVLAGQQFVALNGGALFKFTEAVSFVVTCDSQREIDRFWETLSEGGETSRCGWLRDKFGLSWQIVPAALDDFVSDDNPERGDRVMQALLQMDKLDLTRLQQAARGA